MKCKGMAGVVNVRGECLDFGQVAAGKIAFDGIPDADEVYGKRWKVFAKAAHVIMEAMLNMEDYAALIDLIGMRKVVFKFRLAEDRADVTEEACKSRTANAPRLKPKRKMLSPVR